jgi:hypothetical protein
MNTTLRYQALQEFRKLTPGGPHVLLADVAATVGVIRTAIQHLATEMVKVGMLNVEMVRNSRGGGRLGLYTAGPRLHEDGLLSMRKPVILQDACQAIGKDGATRAEIFEALGRHKEDKAATARLAEWARNGDLKVCVHSMAHGSRAFRYFLTEEDRDAWLAARAPVAKVKAQKAPSPSRVKRAEQRAARRVAKGLKPLTPRVPGSNKPAQPKPKQGAVINRITKAMPKAKLAPVRVLPPALQPGEPRITEQTKVEKRKRPVGRYEVTKRLSGLSTLPPGVYLEPESGWVTAAKNARYLEAA